MIGKLLDRMIGTVSPGWAARRLSARAHLQDIEAFQAGGKITRRIVENLARDVGLNMDQFRNCLSSDRGGRVVRRDVQEGIAAGVNSTPTLFINGKILRGAPKPWVLDQVILQARDTSSGSPAAAASSP